MGSGPAHGGSEGVAAPTAPSLTWAGTGLLAARGTANLRTEVSLLGSVVRWCCCNASISGMDSALPVGCTVAVACTGSGGGVHPAIEGRDGDEQAATERGSPARGTRGCRSAGAPRMMWHAAHAHWLDGMPDISARPFCRSRACSLPATEHPYAVALENGPDSGHRMSPPCAATMASNCAGVIVLMVRPCILPMSASSTSLTALCCLMVVFPSKAGDTTVT